MGQSDHHNLCVKHMNHQNTCIYYSKINLEWKSNCRWKLQTQNDHEIL